MLEKNDLNQISEIVAHQLQLFDENIFTPKLNLLAEGHQTILETLTPKERIEAMEADISVLKMAIRSLTAEVAELKKAQ